MTWTVDIAMPKARELDRRCEHRENSQRRSGDKSGDLWSKREVRRAGRLRPKATRNLRGEDDIDYTVYRIG
jgi:hypothetical protein